MFQILVYFLLKNCNPPPSKESAPLFLTNLPHLKIKVVSSPPFWKFCRRFNPTPSPAERGGAHYVLQGLRKALHDHNLTSIVWKKTLLQLFLYFSVQTETKNYKLIYESQFRHFIKRGKICITFGIFYDPLWASTPNSHKMF